MKTNFNNLLANINNNLLKLKANANSLSIINIPMIEKELTVLRIIDIQNVIKQQDKIISELDVFVNALKGAYILHYKSMAIPSWLKRWQKKNAVFYHGFFQKIKESDKNFISIVESSLWKKCDYFRGMYIKWKNLQSDREDYSKTYSMKMKRLRVLNGVLGGLMGYIEEM